MRRVPRCSGFNFNYASSNQTVVNGPQDSLKVAVAYCRENDLVSQNYARKVVDCFSRKALRGLGEEEKHILEWVHGQIDEESKYIVLPPSKKTMKYLV